ncbi:hypothetical protein GC175_10725 [bacterium]|nr:hypothetical protein [bacterium]
MRPTLKQVLSISAVLSFFFALLFVWMAPIDLHAARSRTNTSHTLSTATLDGPDARLVQRQGIEIRIVAGDQHGVGSALAQELARQLGQRLPQSQIHISDAHIDDASSLPIVLIEITESNLSWTPIWSDAALTAEVVYASDGDLSWRGATSMIIGSEKPTVHSRGTILLTDSSRGLFSQFGYHRHIGTALGNEVYKMIESPLFDPPGS